MEREILFKKIIRPALQHFDSEKAHIATIELLHLAEISPVTLWMLEKLGAYKHKRFTDTRLAVTLGGSLHLDNPIIVAAGWDKSGRAVEALYRLGAASVVVGSVLEYPQAGNPKPRQWMLKNGVAMNRLGFNSPGMETVAKNLARYRGKGIPVGVSIGVNKDILKQGPDAVFASQARIVDRLYDYADYFVVNPSSPNTERLRALQTKGLLARSLEAINNTMLKRGGKKPFFIKIAPDLSYPEIDAVIDEALANELTGIVATNTTSNEHIKAKYGRAGEMLGISGNDDDYRNMSTESVRYIHTEAGNLLEIIGVGGVKDHVTAKQKLDAGAIAIGLVTGIGSEGPTVFGKINRDLVKHME